jgi:hypothetical protein
MSETILMSETIQFVEFCNRFGAGKYNLTVAGELRFQRIQESIATNPEFSLMPPRIATAYAESVFPLNFFINGSQNDTGELDLDDALSFFRDMRFPKKFFRAEGPRGGQGIDVVAAAHPMAPGVNNGTVNSYTPDTSSGDLSDICLVYTSFVNQKIKSLYPYPTGVLKEALNRNLNFLYEASLNCSQVFPYGQC